MLFARQLVVFIMIALAATFSLVSCGKKCDANDMEKIFYNADSCSADSEAVMKARPNGRPLH